MDEQQIRTLPDISLKSNHYLVDTTIPFLYQRRGILMLLKRAEMILGDDVGLGKTVESIVAFTYMKSSNSQYKALVFTEKGALKQWQKEFAWLAPKITTKIVTAETHPESQLRAKTLSNSDTDVLITTYSTAYDYGQYLIEGMGPQFVLFADEPNYFKNPETKLHEKVLEVAVEASRRYGLTATVIENKLEEALGVLRVITPGNVMSRARFYREFCIREKLRNKKIFVTVGYKNLDKFRDEIAPWYYGRRRTDPEVEQKLPEVITKDIEVILSKKQSQKVVEAMDRLFETATGAVKSIETLAALTIAQQMVNDTGLLNFTFGSAKTDALIEMLQNSLEGHRVIVFSRFRTLIDRLEADLTAAGVVSVRITGAESAEERELAIQRFMSDGKDRCNVLLGTRAAQKAINLQKAGHVFFYDLPWSYGLYKQAIGRADRTGSTHDKIGVYRLLACLHPDVANQVGGDKTVDHHVLKVLMKKKKLFDLLTGDETEIISDESEVVEIIEEVKHSWRQA